MFRSGWMRHLERNKFGNLLPPRDKIDKIRHQQVLDRIPFDLADGWFERNDILLAKNLKVMPKQFAESFIKYNQSEVDLLLDRLLRYCVSSPGLSSDVSSPSNHHLTGYSSKTDSYDNLLNPNISTTKNKPNTHFNLAITHNSKVKPYNRVDMEHIIEANSFMYNISQQIDENVDKLSASDCGIILKCFSKMNYVNMDLTLKLMERLLNRLLARGEQFSRYSVLYGLSSVVNILSNGQIVSSQRPSLTRIFERLLAIAMDNLCKFDLNTTSQIVNIISRPNFKVYNELNKISEHILSNYGDEPSQNNPNSSVNSVDIDSNDFSDITGANQPWPENAVYYLANGFSRASILNKPLFDLLYRHMLSNDQYLTYSVDSLVSICNAFSKFGNVIDSGYLDLYVKVADFIVSRYSTSGRVSTSPYPMLGSRSSPLRLNSLHVSVLANAYSKVCVCHEHLFKVLLNTFTADLSISDSYSKPIKTLGFGEYSPRQVAMILHSVVKLGYKCPSLGFLFNRATQDLNLYCWQSLTMLFQSYCKSDFLTDETTDSFVDHFYRLIVTTISDRTTNSTDPSVATSPTESQQGYGKTTLLSLLYSLVKTNTLHHAPLLELISKELEKWIDQYQGDEIVNLVYSFCKIYKHCKTNQLEELELMSLNLLRRLMAQVKSNKFNAFSMVKLAKSFGDTRLIESSDVVLNLVKRNIHLLDRLSYQQVNTIIYAFSVLGINNMDLLTVLNSIKHQKKIPVSSPS